MYCLGKPQAKDIKYKIQEDHYALGGEGVRTNVVGLLTIFFAASLFNLFYMHSTVRRTVLHINYTGIIKDKCNGYYIILNY